MFLQVTHAAVNNCAYCARVFGSVAHQATVYCVDDFWRRRYEDDGAGWDGVNLDGDNGNENRVIKDRNERIVRAREQNRLIRATGRDNVHEQGERRIQE